MNYFIDISEPMTDNGHVRLREDKANRDDAPWTDDELDMLEELGSLPPLDLDEDEDEVSIPTDAELTEWAEDVDALDHLTEEWIED